MLVDKFLEATPESPKQIVSFGAGTDTRFFRLQDVYSDIKFIYHEIDFAANTAAKLSCIQRHLPLYSKLTSSSTSAKLSLPPGATSYHSETYNLHALDLRTLASSPGSTPPQPLPNLDPNIPTLLLSEMCLIYLEPSTVSAILSTFLKTYLRETTPAALILYEPILPHDAFGHTMTSNLASRNIYLPTLSSYPTLAHQRERLKNEGFVDGNMAADINFIWREWIHDDEKERVADLEMLDELEELELLLKHYCIAWGWRDCEVGKEGIFARAWDDVPEQTDVGGNDLN